MTKSALLVIDFINDIAHPNGKIARSAERIIKNRVLEHANTLTAKARQHGWPIIFIKVGFTAGYPECPKHSPLFSSAPTHGALLLGTWGTEFHEQLAIEPNDIQLIKHRVSCFYSTPLDALLSAQEIDTLILAGTATNMAIEHTARDAHDRDYQVIVVQDACESATAEAHDAALASMSRFSKITSSAALKLGVF